MLHHKGTVELQTERLLLRRLRVSDSGDFFTNLVNDKEVLRYTAWPYHETIEQTVGMLTAWCGAYEKPLFYCWGVEFEGKIIGNLTVYRIYEDTNSLEIGYCFGKEHWNKGFATEAVKAVTDFLFSAVNAEKIIVSFASGNPASGKVAEKCGMTYVKTDKAAFTTQSGEVVDVIEYEKNRCVN